MGKVHEDAGPRTVTVSPSGIAPTSAVGPPTLHSWRDFDPAQLEGSARDLAVELTTYRDRLDEILSHGGEYVVIKGDRVAGYHADRDAAMRAAIDEFGRERVLIMKVVESQPAIRFGNAR